MAKKTKSEIKKRIADLRKLDISKMYMNDFYLTWDKTDDEIAAVFEVAEILRGLRENNIWEKMLCQGRHL